MIAALAHAWQWVISDPKESIPSLVMACSVLHTFLPPWDWHPQFVEEGLKDFPLAQRTFYSAFNNRWYKLLVYVVGFVALNGRSTIWRFISVKNADGPNANMKAIATNIVEGTGTAEDVHTNLTAATVVAQAVSDAKESK